MDQVHQVITTMLCTAELDMAETVVTNEVEACLTDATWTSSTYHTVRKATPGAAIVGRGTLFNITFLVDWNNIGDRRQCQTDFNTKQENHSCHDWDYKVGDKVLLRKDGILCKSESWYECDPWTIASVHTNRTIRVQGGT